MGGFLVGSCLYCADPMGSPKGFSPLTIKKAYTVVGYRKHYLGGGGGQKANSLSGVRDCFSVINVIIIPPYLSIFVCLSPK